jgi:hypothetical protein
MSSGEICDKLRDFLQRHCPMTEECHAVYLMVELRKIIEQQQLPVHLLRYYADWTLHSNKGRGHGPVSPASENLYCEAMTLLKAPALAHIGSAPAFEKFGNMDDLRNEMAAILAHLGIQPDRVVSDENWSPFVCLLTEVLANQPIVNPSANVAMIRFEPTKRVCVIEFKKTVGARKMFRQSVAKTKPSTVLDPNVATPNP